MKKILILTISSLILLTSCNNNQNIKENNKGEVVVNQINKEIKRISKRDEYLVNNLLEGLIDSKDKKILLDYKNLKISRDELKVKLDGIKKDKEEKLDKISNSGNIELIKKIETELNLLEKFKF